MPLGSADLVLLKCLGELHDAEREGPARRAGQQGSESPGKGCHRCLLSPSVSLHRCGDVLLFGKGWRASVNGRKLPGEEQEHFRDPDH